MKIYIYHLIVFLSVLLVSCSKDENKTTPAYSTRVSASVTGIVYDISNTPIAGATVQLGDLTTTTNNFGYFNFEKVHVKAGRNVVEISKTGYWKRFQAIQLQKGTSMLLHIPMEQMSFSHTLNANSGGTIAINGSSITFPANAFATENGTIFTGTAYLAINTTYTNDPDFHSSYPGGDLLAEANNGDTVVLYSYGMLGVEIQDAMGNSLQLTNGKTATLSIPINPSQQLTAPMSIPLWFFDEESGLWKQDGAALRTGNMYSGEVTHFTWWNFDIPSNFAWINGFIRDCEGTPVAGAYLFAQNSFFLTTDAYGFYTAPVPINTPLILQASYGGQISATSSFQATIGSHTYILPDLIVPCTKGTVTGTLINCNANLTDGYICFFPSTGSPVLMQTINGTFTGRVSGDPSTDYFAVSASGKNAGTIAVLPYPDTTFLAPIQLCDTISGTSSNSRVTADFYIPGAGNYLIADTVITYTIGTVNNGTYPVFVSNAPNSPDTTIVFSGDIPSTPGNYTTNGTTTYMLEVTSAMHTIELYPAVGTFSLFYANPTNQEYRFSYSGTANYYSPTLGNGTIPVVFSFDLEP